MNSKLKVKVSQYMSYLLRHNSENLNINNEGFVDLDGLLSKLRERYNVDKCLISEIVNQGNQKRFEIVGNKIRALYGHSLDVKVGLEEDKLVEVLYHGTTPASTSEILKNGLKPMKRNWVHLSPTKEMAVEVGRRRTLKPVILRVNAKEARKNGIRFFKATERVFICCEVPPEYIRPL